MVYAQFVTLGPTAQAVPQEMWEEFQERDWLFLWEVHCKSYGRDTINAYRVSLVRKGSHPLEVGHTIQSVRGAGKSWNAFGSAGWPSVEGFATRTYAIEYMLRCGGYTKKDY